MSKIKTFLGLLLEKVNDVLDYVAYSAGYDWATEDCFFKNLQDIEVVDSDDEEVVLPILKKWKERIASVFLVSMEESMPIRTIITRQTASAEASFSIEFAPKTCMSEDRYPNDWVARFTFSEKSMQLDVHDVETIKHDTTWVDGSFSEKDDFSNYCTEFLLAVYLSCNKCHEG